MSGFRTAVVPFIAAASLFGCEIRPSECRQGPSSCGCMTDETLLYRARVIDKGTWTPLSGIQVFCDAEQESVATSDASGKVSFTVARQRTENCGPSRCGLIGFFDPSNQHWALQRTDVDTNNLDVELERRPVIFVNTTFLGATKDSVNWEQWDGQCAQSSLRAGAAVGSPCLFADRCAQVCCGCAQTVGGKSYAAASCVNGVCTANACALVLAVEQRLCP
jgi:hypothetical protein